MGRHAAALSSTSLTNELPSRSLNGTWQDFCFDPLLTGMRRGLQALWSLDAQALDGLPGEAPDGADDLPADARLLPLIPPETPGVVAVRGERHVFAIDRGMTSRLLVRAVRADGSARGDGHLTFHLGNIGVAASLGVAFDTPLGVAQACDERGEVVLLIDCTRAAFLANGDPYDNEILIEVLCDLGSRLTLTLRLRDLLDVGKSDLHFFLVDGEQAKATLSGCLRRRNGEAELALLSGSDTLRIRGADGEAVETGLRFYEQKGAWLHATALLADADRLDCTLHPGEGLDKRVYFACSGAFGPARIIRAPQARVDVQAAQGLIVDGSTYCVDRGGVYHFTVNVTDACGPIAGLPLVLRETRAGGVVYRCAGPSDRNGDIRISADTRAAEAGSVHALLLHLPGIDLRLNLKVYEFVQARLVECNQVAGRVRAVIELERCNGQPFADLGAWRGQVRMAGGAPVPFMHGHVPGVVRVSTGWLPAACPGTLEVGLAFPTGLDRLLVGAREFGVGD